MLFSNRSWPVNLRVKSQKPELYTPHSDFSIVMNEFPVLILEVESDTNRTDQRRMLLQAACLVRLGNALIKNKDPNFFIKAIYINSDYVANEYTCYENEPDCSAHIKRVIVLPSPE